MEIQAGDSDPTAEQMQKMARLFENIKVTPQVHRAVCLELSAWHPKAALEEGRKALDEKFPDTDQFYTWVVLSSICGDLAGAGWSTDEEDAGSTPLSKKEMEHAIAAQAYAEKALAVYPDRTSAATLSEHIQWHIQQAYINLANSKWVRGQYEDAIQVYEEARAIDFRLGYLLGQITAIMSQQQQYDKIITTIQNWNTLQRTYWLALNEQDDDSVHEVFQKAAKKTGKEEFMVHAYQELITILDLDGNAAILRFWLASAYHSVLRNDEEAKRVLNEILDGTTCKDPVTVKTTSLWYFVQRRCLPKSSTINFANLSNTVRNLRCFRSSPAYQVSNLRADLMDTKYTIQAMRLCMLG